MTAEKRSFDYVVVGAGSAGSAVAARLSEDADVSVLLLEAGGWDARPEIHQVNQDAVLALLASPWSPQIDWGYVTEAEPHLDGRRVPVARGKVVGGSSSVNALMWVRGNPADYDAWAAAGNPGWAYDDLLPYFRRSESYDGEPSPWRGADGPVAVRRLTDPTEVAQAFVAGAGELGFGEPGDYNAEKQEDFGFYYQTTRTPADRRSSTASAYLRPALSRPNLGVEVGAQAVRLNTEAGRVVSVDYLAHGRPRTAYANAEIVLCAGAFETPKLLMLSGIGPADHLRELGIDCRLNLPGVGRELQDHLFTPVCYQARTAPFGPSLLSEAGLFTTVGNQPTGGSPDLQFTFGAVKFPPVGATPEQAEGPGFTFAPIGLLPQARGELRLRGSDPAAPALVRANYLDNDADLTVLVEGVKLAREIAHTRAFDPLRGVPLGLADSGVTVQEIRDFVRANATTLWHPVGTCRMGADEGAVVDAELRVRGIDGLRIADASIMPRIVAGNTNAPSVMVGEKAADLLRTAR